MALLVLFILTPVIEIAVFIEVGGFIGLWPTLGVVVVTAVLGTTLLRRQGMAVFFRAQEEIARGQFPVTEVFDGMCLLFAGALLLTPGFVTDITGFLLFVPPIRRAIRHAVLRYLERSGKMHVWVDGEPRPSDPPPGGTIEGDFREVGPDDSDGGPSRRP